jgi:hypothetical protein
MTRNRALLALAVALLALGVALPLVLANVGGGSGGVATVPTSRSP